MVLFKISAFFTALIHCVMALFQGQPIYYDAVSPIPDMGILRTPSYDKTSEEPTSVFIVKPSWHDKSEASVFDDSVKNSQGYKPKIPKAGTPVKGIEHTYPRRVPRVKLEFLGSNGMLPVKKNEDPPVNKPEHSSKVKIVKSDISEKDNDKDKLVGRVELHKDINVSLLGKLGKHELKLDSSKVPAGSYGHGQLQLQEALFKPEHNPVQHGLGLNPYTFVYPLPGLYYGNNQHQQFPFTSTNSPVLPGTDALSPTTVNYLTNPGQVHNPEKTNPYYGTQIPETAMSNAQIPNGVHDPPNHTYQPTLPFEVLKPVNHEPTQPDFKDVELPPVPTLTTQQRLQLALLNTVAGLPGGFPQALDALRPN